MTKIAALKNLVNAKMDNNFNATINYTGAKTLRNGNGFEFHYDTNEDTWTVYNGCELIIGDTTFEHCANCVLAEIAS